MRGVPHELKDAAINLRKKGLSIGAIENRLRINRSTLSGWFKSVPLSEKQRAKLHQDWKNALVSARKKAVLWHNLEKQKRLQNAEEEASATLKSINTADKNTLDLALSMLYLGEGSKKADETSMGNSDPLILKTFLCILQKNYSIDLNKVRCELHLRADQNPEKLKQYWANELNLPTKCFKYFHIDKRTTGSKTYPEYKGVCMVRYGDVAIKRKLLNISKRFCEQLTMRP